MFFRLFYCPDQLCLQLGTDGGADGQRNDFKNQSNQFIVLLVKILLQEALFW
jgi:hypothetical protein